MTRTLSQRLWTALTFVLAVPLMALPVSAQEEGPLNKVIHPGARARDPDSLMEEMRRFFALQDAKYGAPDATTLDVPGTLDRTVGVLATPTFAADKAVLVRLKGIPRGGFEPDQLFGYLGTISAGTVTFGAALYSYEFDSGYTPTLHLVPGCNGFVNADGPSARAFQIQCKRAQLPDGLDPRKAYFMGLVSSVGGAGMDVTSAILAKTPIADPLGAHVTVDTVTASTGWPGTIDMTKDHNRVTNTAEIPYGFVSPVYQDITKILLSY